QLCSSLYFGLHKTGRTGYLEYSPGRWKLLSMMTLLRWKRAPFQLRLSHHRLPVPVQAESTGKNKATEKTNDDVGTSFYSISMVICSVKLTMQANRQLMPVLPGARWYCSRLQLRPPGQPAWRTIAAQQIGPRQPATGQRVSSLER